jgi:N-acetylneuraminate synthase
MVIDFNQLKEPYLIAEIGINHNGDMQIAKKLIDATFATGWNCAKFQKRTPDICVPEHQKSIERDTPWGKMTYLDYKKRLEFEEPEYDQIMRYCKDKPIDWTASVWDLNSLEFILRYDTPPFLKIPSALITDLELLTETAKSGLPVIISTGMSSIDEVDEAVKMLEKYASQFVVMHCNSSYPAKIDELNLSLIPKLQKRYQCVIGYSGHEYGLDSTTMAVVLGAKVIERHVTIDRSLWGTDQKSSVEIQGMDKLYKQINSVSKTLGDGEKRVFESEMPIRKKLRGV